VHKAVAPRNKPTVVAAVNLASLETNGLRLAYEIIGPHHPSLAISAIGQERSRSRFNATGVEYTPSQAEKRFELKGKKWCGMVLFDVKAALDVIRDCKADSIPLLGIEGFTLGTQAGREIVHASTADILDTSSDAVEAYTRSIAFVSDPQRKELFFEFVFGD